VADKISFDLVAPERLLLSDEADMVTLPATEGYIGVMAGHAPVMTTLRPGLIDVSKDGKDERYFVHGGFADIGPTKVTILAEEALPLSEMDIAVLDQQIRDAEEDLAAASNDDDRQRIGEMLDDLRLVRAAF
jgi:F-type H+-transporting ATPase subunit epsilon